MFVDVGAKRDGLVHVKDISRNYFISNHQSVGVLFCSVLFCSVLFSSTLFCRASRLLIFCYN